jgi:hypothetical protein
MWLSIADSYLYCRVYEWVIYCYNVYERLYGDTVGECVYRIFEYCVSECERSFW